MKGKKKKKAFRGEFEIDRELGQSALNLLMTEMNLAEVSRTRCERKSPALAGLKGQYTLFKLRILRYTISMR